ncbi:mRNA decay activator protein zfp36 [Anaeramoeba ignava]|uniref:mRNA decay activator protein zfp36 n=1 Tax=Anaeramoeba ignava TaxID=1746090 RepID=A0A9Q0R641_ANAIG|nr:mRNA decay activator protein zfp36 [Anaeramoeba ignava]|eukprot:Anaeramoba_ignava/c16444_g1_i2.p1 GENE.c16444_g1_i2~~c16444_g1_i2.p1  ORF type:complete len:230 (-),score=56.33 c16444_g1_i2:74-763(-)
MTTSTHLNFGNNPEISSYLQQMIFPTTPLNNNLSDLKNNTRRNMPPTKQVSHSHSNSNSAIVNALSQMKDTGRSHKVTNPQVSLALTEPVAIPVNMAVTLPVQQVSSRFGTVNFPVVPNNVSPQNPQKERYKTEMCRSWEETGTCRYGSKCQFAHGYHELRPILRHPRYKTQVCKSFHENGFCPYGKRCRFIHSFIGSLPFSSQQPQFQEIKDDSIKRLPVFEKLAQSN